MLKEPHNFDYERNWIEFKKSKDFENKYFWWIFFAIILIALIF